MLGLRGVSGASTETFTSASPLASEFINHLEVLVRKCEVGRGGMPLVLMHQRRASWLREKCSTATVPLPVAWSAPRVPGALATLNGAIQIIVDPNIPTTISTNQDTVIVVRDSSILGDVYASPPVLFVDLTSKSSTLEAVVIVRQYLAASFSRVPSAVGLMTGSGLAAP